MDNLKLIEPYPMFGPGSEAFPDSPEKPEGCAVEITERPVTDPRMAKSFPGSLWRLRLTPPASALQEAVFEFQRRERTDESDSE